MAILVNTPADAVASFIESRGLDTGFQLRVGSRTSDENQITVTDYAVRKDGDLMTGEELDVPRVQVRVRHDDYPKAYDAIRNIRNALNNLSQSDLFLLDYPDGCYLFSSFTTLDGPTYMGRDPKPGQLENFAISGEVVLISFTSP